MGFVSSPLRVTGKLAPEGEPWPLVCLQPEPASGVERGRRARLAGAGGSRPAAPGFSSVLAHVRPRAHVPLGGEGRGYHRTGRADHVQGPATAVVGRIMAFVTGRRWYGETAGSGHRLLLMSEPATDSGMGVGCC